MALEHTYSKPTSAKRTMWAMRISPRIKYLAEIAARSQGKTLSNFVEGILEESFKKITVLDQREAMPGLGGSHQAVHGKTLAELGDALYQNTDAARFLALVNIAPWLLSDAEHKLLRILQHSDYYSPLSNSLRILHDGRIQQHWEMLVAIRDGEADIDILPKDQRPRASVAFGMLSEPERVALYKADPVKYKRQREAYNQAMKGNR